MPPDIYDWPDDPTRSIRRKANLRAITELALIIAPIGVIAQTDDSATCVPTLWYDSATASGSEIFQLEGANPGSGLLLAGAGNQATKPHVSPDGRQIAYVRQPPSPDTEEPEIWIAEIDGDNARPLAPGMDSDQPSWSPDGSRLAFSSTVDGTRSLYVIDASGENLRRITDGNTNDDYPAWSPDGELIAYGAIPREGGNFDIFTIRPDGRDIQQLTFHSAADFRPAWSPDGSQLAFSSTRGDPTFETTFNWDIYVMGSDGSDVRQLTFHEPLALRPSWSPIGDEIAYQVGGLKEDESDWEIYKVSVNGGDPTRLTNNSVTDSHPDWNTLSHACKL